MSKEERLLDNAYRAWANSTSQWAKDYWEAVLHQLTRKFKRGN